MARYKSKGKLQYLELQKVIKTNYTYLLEQMDNVTKLHTKLKEQLAEIEKQKLRIEGAKEILNKVSEEYKQGQEITDAK